MTPPAQPAGLSECAFCGFPLPSGHSAQPPATRFFQCDWCWGINRIEQDWSLRRPTLEEERDIQASAQILNAIVGMRDHAKHNHQLSEH